MRRLLVAGVLIIGIWVVFAQAIVPSVIDSAYRGESLPVLNDLIKGQYAHPVGHYLELWNRKAAAILLVALGLWLVALIIAWERRRTQAVFVPEATAGVLGAIRMWTCLVLLVAISVEDLASIASLPSELRQQIGLMRYASALPGFQAFVTSATALWTFQWLTQLLLFVGALGLWTRAIIPLATLCHVMLLGLLIDYSFFWHQNLVPLYLLGILSFTPCGDAWSLDRLLKIYRRQPVPEASRTAPVYSWARYTCWIVIAMPYLENGLAKLRDGGLFWWNATNMRAILFYDTLTPREYDWTFSLRFATAPDLLFAALGLSALLAEISYGLVLVSPTARRVLPVVAIGMHLSILLLQRILFIDLILLQLIFYDWRKIRTAVGQRLASARGRLEVLYDGACPLCLSTVRLLRSVDLLHQLEFYDFRRLDIRQYTSRHGLKLGLAELEKEMYVISPKDAYHGFHAYRAIAWRVPLFWPLAVWLSMPVVTGLGKRVYRYIANNRRNILTCETHCATETTPVTNATVMSQTIPQRVPLRYPLAVWAIIIVFLICWFYRIEFYPLTAWHLYESADDSGTITYLKVTAKYESGEVGTARIEDALGAMAYDGRYSRAIAKCFGEETQVDFCRTFLAAAASSYNAKVPPGKRIEQYLIEKWKWDFHSEPADPQYGRLLDRFVVAVGKR